jgi:metallo-beta-lactamase family protein
MPMTKRKSEKIRVRFVGQNSHEVTGSCIHIQMEDKQILLECGLYQSCKSPVETYKANAADLGFKPKDIDLIFMCHAHADHIGRAPYLYKKGCRADIIAPTGTETISKILLMDSSHIAEKDAELIAKRTGKACERFYDDNDVENTMLHWNEYDFNEVYDIGNGVSFRFIPSGHILNSAQLELWLTQNNHTKKIVYTSDLGNTSVHKYYVTDFQPVEHCNLLIGETTYADKTRTITKKDREKDLEKIKAVILDKCVEQKGKVLFPVFANDRCQNVLSYLFEIFGNDPTFDIPILIDSPMAINISKAYLELLPPDQLELYEKVFNWKNVHLVQDYNESKSWQASQSPAVILSCSGMMTNGRVIQHVKKILPNSKNHILFVGFSAIGSLAAKIKEGKSKTITIEQKSVANRCGITSLISFSSHAQHDSLMEYYSNVNCEKVALVHGDYKTKCEFAEELQEEISRKNRTSKVICVNKSTEILL